MMPPYPSLRNRTADVASVPFMGGLISAASGLVSVAQAVQSNNVSRIAFERHLISCRDTLEIGCGLTCEPTSTAPESELTGYCQNAFIELHQVFQSLLERIQPQARGNWTSRVLRYRRHKEDIERDKAEFIDALREFSVTIQWIHMSYQQRTQQDLQTVKTNQIKQAQRLDLLLLQTQDKTRRKVLATVILN